MSKQRIAAMIEAVPVPKNERRRKSRAKISKSMRVRPVDPKRAEEVQPTRNASRDGFYFATSAAHYYVGMHIRITFPYESPVDNCNLQHLGDVVRVDRLKDGRFGIAVRILLR